MLLATEKFLYKDFFLQMYRLTFPPCTYRTGCKSNMGTVKKISFFWNRACCGREAFIAVFISGNLNPQSGTQICLARPCWKEDKTIFTFVVSNKSVAICDWKLGPKCRVNYEADRVLVLMTFSVWVIEQKCKKH